MIALYYAESKLRPVVQQFLYNALRERLGGAMDDELWDEYMKTEVVRWTRRTPRSVPVLALGNSEDNLDEWHHVDTLSQAQIATFPSARTDVLASFDLLMNPPVYRQISFNVVDGLDAEQEKALGPVLVVDIETSSDGRDYADLLPNEHRMLCIGINDGKNIYVFTEESLDPSVEDNAIEQIKRILLSGRKLIAHNMKFDFRTIAAVFGIELYGHLDTMLLLHAIYPGRKAFGLKEACHHFLGAPDWESEQKQYFKRGNKDFAQIPRAVLYTYNAYDVYWTWFLYEYLAERSDERTQAIARHEFSMSNFFQDVENNMMAVDLEYLDELSQLFLAEKEAHAGKLRALVGDETFNPGSPKQVKEAFLSTGLEIESTDAKKVLIPLRETLADDNTLAIFIDELLAYKDYEKKYGTYVKGLLQRTHYGNLVSSTFKVHGTNTGRLSSADPNVQNIPRNEEGAKSLRRIFVPRAADRIMLNVDYSQAELRVMAKLSQDKELIKLFQPGAGDFFDNLMPVMFPRDVPDVAAIKKLDKSTKKNMRAKEKAVVYGLSYGRQALAIANELKMPVRDAQAMIDNYFDQFPDFYDWRQTITAIALSEEENLMSPFGRYFQSELVTGRNRQNVLNSALAFVPQSTASDLCVIAAMRSHQWLREEYGSDALIVATVHDAILLDVKQGTEEAIGLRVQHEMRQSGIDKFGTEVIFETDMTVGSSWGEADDA